MREAVLTKEKGILCFTLFILFIHPLI
jgi:hypothetical protein